jgi:hypothetical protein
MPAITRRIEISGEMAGPGIEIAFIGLILRKLKVRGRIFRRSPKQARKRGAALPSMLHCVKADPPQVELDGAGWCRHDTLHDDAFRHLRHLPDLQDLPLASALAGPSRHSLIRIARPASQRRGYACLRFEGIST